MENTITLCNLKFLIFPLVQLPHRAGHHLFKLVGGYAKRLVDVLQ